MSTPITRLDLTSLLPAGFAREDLDEETVITAPDGSRFHVAEHEDGAFTWHEADEDGNTWGHNGTDSAAAAAHAVTQWAATA